MNKTFASLKGMNIQIYLDDICLAEGRCSSRLAISRNRSAVHLHRRYRRVHRVHRRRGIVQRQQIDRLEILVPRRKFAGY